MSYPYDAAAMKTVLEHLRQHVTDPLLTYRNSGIQPGGHPPPRSPELYVAVDEEGIVNEARPEQDHLKERIRIAVWISTRAGRKPTDRRGDIYLETVAALAPTERQVIASLHGQVALIAAMNANLASGEQGVQEGLWYTGRSQTAIKDAGWSHEEGGEVVGWISRRLQFIGFRRVQSKYSLA